MLQYLLVGSIFLQRNRKSSKKYIGIKKIRKKLTSAALNILQKVKSTIPGSVFKILRRIFSEIIFSTLLGRQPSYAI